MGLRAAKTCPHQKRWNYRGSEGRNKSSIIYIIDNAPSFGWLGVGFKGRTISLLILWPVFCKGWSTGGSKIIFGRIWIRIDNWMNLLVAAGRKEGADRGNGFSPQREVHSFPKLHCSLVAKRRDILIKVITLWAYCLSSLVSTRR